jgi:hypothetical protein
MARETWQEKHGKRNMARETWQEECGDRNVAGEIVKKMANNNRT